MARPIWRREAPARGHLRENPILIFRNFSTAHPGSAFRAHAFLFMEAAVTEIIAKLSAWHQKHLQLQDARLRLKQVPPDRGINGLNWKRRSIESRRSATLPAGSLQLVTRCRQAVFEGAIAPVEFLSVCFRRLVIRWFRNPRPAARTSALAVRIRPRPCRDCRRRPFDMRTQCTGLAN